MNVWKENEWEEGSGGSGGGIEKRISSSMNEEGREWKEMKSELGKSDEMKSK